MEGGMGGRRNNSKKIAQKSKSTKLPNTNRSYQTSLEAPYKRTTTSKVNHRNNKREKEKETGRKNREEN